MASPVISTPVRPPRPQATEGLRLVDLTWRDHLVRVLLFSLPFLGVALLVHRLAFLSNMHAHIVEKALLAADRLRLEVIGFLYPPLPFLSVLVFPRSWMPSVLASIAAGGIAWLLWYDLERTGLPRLWRMLLTVSVVATPTALYLATQAYPEVLALHLVVVAWHYYWNFVRYGHTFSGFVAGLVLGLAFYANFYAFLYAITLAGLVPLFRRSADDSRQRRGHWATLSQMLVTVFPALWTAASWTYINWVFTGNPFTYLAGPVAAVIDSLHWRAPLAERLEWLREFALELLAQPLLLAVLALNAWRHPRRVVVLALLATLPSLIRLAGLAYGLPLALGTYTLLALLALPERLPRWVGPFLVLFALLQGISGTALVLREAEVRQWEHVLTTGQARTSDLDERALATALRQAPPRSILADDRGAYRLIARTESARSFLLPADADFPLALGSPKDRVQYILVSPSAPEDDVVSAQFRFGPPPGFVVDGFRADWIVYRRQDAPSLLGTP